MGAIFFKELHVFFSSMIGYLSMAVFLLALGLFLWVFPDYSLLDYGYASLDQLFAIAPWIFIFLIPSITMRSLAEETQTGTLELLITRPLRLWEIVLGKYAACLTLVVFALLPTVVYYYSVYQLGSPVGNLDSGAIFGSYIGLVCLGSVLVSIGMFASSMTNNQIVAFLVAAFLSFFCTYGFLYLSQLPVFYGANDAFVQSLGIEAHYESISRGLVDTRDMLYFASATLLFLSLSVFNLQRAIGQ
jgi:ABC-2 type transport system permease protein